MIDIVPVQTSPFPLATQQERLPRGRFEIAQDASGLLAVRDPSVTLSIWERALPESLPGALEAWAASDHPTYEYRGPSTEAHVGRALTGLDETARSWLERDLADLLQRFVAVTGSDHVRLSFGVERSDKCRKFHVDHLRFRLITTYLGPGTEWVPADAVNHAAMGHPTDCPCDANKDIVRDPAAVRHARAGDVLIMRGTQNSREEGAVHRSPPIAETGTARVVYILSTVP